MMLPCAHASLTPFCLVRMRPWHPSAAMCAGIYALLPLPWDAGLFTQGPNGQATMLRNMRTMVELHGRHPAVLGWVLGNEINLNVGYQVRASLAVCVLGFCGSSATRSLPCPACQPPGCSGCRLVSVCLLTCCLRLFGPLSCANLTARRPCVTKRLCTFSSSAPCYRSQRRPPSPTMLCVVLTAGAACAA